MNVSVTSAASIGQPGKRAYTCGNLLIAADTSLPTVNSRPQKSTIDLMFLRIVQEDFAPYPRWLLAASLLLFALLAWSYRQQTPLLETPDEPSHFEITNYIAQNGALPPRPEITRTGPAPAVSADTPFYYAPPLYYLLASLLVSKADAAQFAQAVVPNPNFERGVGINLGLGSENKNMYVHTAVQRQPFLAEWAVSMWRIRLFSLFLGMATVVGCYALARQLWPKSWPWQLTAVALVLFNPTFLYLSNGVTNDALLIALGSWCFVLMGSLLQTGDAKIGWREWILGLLLGCAILTKQTGFILLPPALLLMVHKARQQKWSYRRLFAVLGVGAAIVTAVGGWWYLANGFLYGDPLALESHNALMPVGNGAERLLFLVAQSWGAFKSYWAAFGWATIFVKPIWYIYFAALTILGISGWLWKQPFSNKGSSAKLTLLLRLVVLLNGGLMLVWLWRTAAPYGRLLFPVIAPIACLLVLGWQRWLTRLGLNQRLPEAIVQLGVVLPLAALALLSPVRYLQPSYAPVAVDPAEAGEFISLNATFSERYQLLGYIIAPQTVQAGETVTLTLFWQLSQPTTSPNSVETFIQVAPLDPEAQVAATSQLLGTARYPAAFWQPNEIVVQQHQLEIVSNTPAPSLYWFDVVLFDETLQARLPVTWQGQTLIEDLFRVGPQPILSSKLACSKKRPFLSQPAPLNTLLVKKFSLMATASPLRPTTRALR